MALEDVKNAILRAKVDGSVKEIWVKTGAKNVVVDEEGTNLATKITAIEGDIDAEETARKAQIGALGNKTEAQGTEGEADYVPAVEYTVKQYVDDKVAEAAGDASDDITYTNENGTTVAVGGIAKGTTFDEKSLKDIIEDMLYPYVAIVGGSLSMTVKDSDSNREVGHAITVTNASVSFTKGSKNCVKAEVFDGTTSLGATEGTALTSSVAVDITDTEINPDVAATAKSGSKSFTAKVTDANNTTVASGSVTYTFYRPYYVGNAEAIPTTADEITALTKTVASRPNTLTASTAANKYWVIAYPAAYGDVKATKGVVDANGFDVTGNLIKQSNITITCLDGKDVAYKVYAGLKGTAAATFTVNLNA